MLLLIGLQSGKGLHPDQTINCQNCQDRQKSPKLIISAIYVQFCLLIQTACTAAFQFGFFGNYQCWQLALPLFMFRVFADHAHHALAVHDLALVTNLLY
jgi:hypothetical protein